MERPLTRNIKPNVDPLWLAEYEKAGGYESVRKALRTMAPQEVQKLVTESTLLQTGVADEYRGRVFGAYGTTQALTVLIGMGLASALGDLAGVVPLFNLVGGLYVLSGLVILAMVGRRAAPMETTALGGEPGV